VLSEDKAAVALLKAAAAKAVKAYTASPTNSTLLAASKVAATTFSVADVALTQKKVDVASLLAFFAGVFSFGIGILKVGKVMNLMGPAVSTRPLALPCCARPRRMRSRRDPQSPASRPPPQSRLRWGSSRTSLGTATTSRSRRTWTTSSSPSSTCGQR
jgi:hypothetical protein